MSVIRKGGWMSSMWALAFLVVGQTAHASPREFSEYQLTDGKQAIPVRFVVATPDNFDPAMPHPVMLLLPGGDQGEAMVEAALDRVETEATSRGWIVVCPAISTPGVLFHRRGDYVIPSLVEEIRARYLIEGDGRLHAVGAGNGGASALRVAVDYPMLIRAVTMFPGISSAGEDMARATRLSGVPVDMYVGETDTAWLKQDQRLANHLSKLRIPHTLVILPGDDRSLSTLPIKTVLDMMDARRLRVEPVASDDVNAISAVLSELHEAASHADESRYFELYTADAVFLGTDPGERWTLDAFKAFAQPYFEREEAWTYISTKRHITVAPSGATAWFDERLDNKRMGVTRGSGALRLVDGKWRITQYNLSIPIPNDVTDEVVGVVRGASELKMYHPER